MFTWIYKKFEDKFYKIFLNCYNEIKSTKLGNNLPASELQYKCIKFQYC